MTIIFSSVEADITTDLISKFPGEFDFDTMIRKVCDDAGVVVEVPSKEDKPEQKYRLRGLWLEMEKAYKHLVTTLALYGARLGDDMAHTIDIEGRGLTEILVIPGTDVGDEDVNEIGVRSDSNRCHENSVSRNVLEDSKNKKPRRPRKSAVQSRKLIANLKSKDIFEDGDGEYEVFDLRTKDNNENGEEIDSKIKSDDSTGKENSINFMEEKNKDEEISSEREQQLPKPECIEKPPARKCGRPKKFEDDNNDGVSEYPCSQCSFIGRKKSKLHSHMRRMHMSSAPTSCSVCQKVFPNKRYMKRHKATHTEPQHCCDICGKMYKIKKAMIDHRKTHDSTYEKPSFKCDDCPKSFCSQYILDCHVRDIHKGQKKSFLCSVCGKSFTTKHSLNEHSNAHIGLKPHACETCGKTFSYESALRDHKFSHLDSKQFWCKHCQKGFSQRSGLKMHMRTHRLNKMFTCSECGRGFTQKQALQRHERVHKGEKPFICKHCGRSFTDASIIRRHLILVHKIDKAPLHWREDIICTIVANTDHHVQKLGEDDKMSTIEKEKEEVLHNVGLQNKSHAKKGPSRAFQRIYPRRVAILDDEDNVIAPPEMSVSVAVSSSDFIPNNNKVESTIVQSNNPVFQLKSLTSQSPAGPSLIVSDGGVEIDSAPQLLNQTILDPSQWDVLDSHLNKGISAKQLEQILGDPNQSDMPRAQDQAQNIHKMIKCETSQAIAGEAVVNQGDYQIMHSPRYSPVSFNPIGLSSHSKSMDTQFEALTGQLTQASSQYYDIRATSQSTWPPMYYYTHIVSQFGVGGNINSDFSYIHAANSSNAHVGSSVIPTSIEMQHTSIIPSTLDSTATTSVQNMPALLQSNALPGQKMDTRDPGAQTASVILSTELPNIAHGHDSNSDNTDTCHNMQDNVDHF